jgi:predicted ester cyclase
VSGTGFLGRCRGKLTFVPADRLSYDGEFEQDQDLRAVFAGYLATCNSHELTRLGEWVAVDVRIDDEPVGLAEWIRRLRAVVRGFPDIRWEARRVLVDGDLVAASIDGFGTHGGTYLGIAPTHREVRTTAMNTYRIEGGLIRDIWVRTDPAALLAAIL